MILSGARFLYVTSFANLFCQQIYCRSLYLFEKKALAFSIISYLDFDPNRQNRQWILETSNSEKWQHNNLTALRDDKHRISDISRIQLHRQRR